MESIGEIFVVIPVHNRVNFTRNCLESLEKQTFKHFNIIVVDDGSTDGTSEMLRVHFPDVKVVKGDGNLWWTGGINLGIEKALELGADYVFTLNDDTIAPSNLIEEMVKHAQRKPSAIFGALEVDMETKRPLYAGHSPNWLWDNAVQLLDKIPHDNLKGIQQISFFHGRGLWIPKEVFLKIGLFDQKRFPHYLADFDFVYNAYKEGFEVFCNLDAVIYSFPEACGSYMNKEQKSLGNYYNHLFSMSGGGNLTDFTRFTFKNCPPYAIPTRLVMGYLRRIFGYWV
ncbi:glycosyltransferase family 2 protein [Catalinimonas sp. 4WD22]|uniref:glycosyltransferase family 2 protein n=1 Tax=Catalinimonas locisalis TaxID=3133978 RepID=UPI003101A86F